jgi:hypothetical protein
VSVDDAGDTKIQAAKWYHWASLSACTVIMLAIGAFELLQGADPSSRFFAVDTIVVRILGAGLVLCAFWLPMRHDRAFVASMLLLGLTIAENFVTYRFESSSPAQTATVLATVVVAFGAPLFVLSDLRRVFGARTAVPPD